jgi:hypothetical protein
MTTSAGSSAAADTAAEEAQASRPQSAAAPSPFPAIDEYAFLSDCHTGARDRLYPALPHR